MRSSTSIVHSFIFCTVFELCEHDTLCFNWSHPSWLNIITTLSQNKTVTVMFLRTNFNEFHTSITAVRVRLFHYYSLNLNRHQMCPQIWDCDPGHNNSPPCPVLPVLCGICFWRCRPHWPSSFLFAFVLVFLPIRTTGGDSRLNKILFKFYCFFFNMNI